MKYEYQIAYVGFPFDKDKPFICSDHDSLQEALNAKRKLDYDPDYNQYNLVLMYNGKIINNLLDSNPYMKDSKIRAKAIRRSVETSMAVDRPGFKFKEDIAK